MKHPTTIIHIALALFVACLPACGSPPTQSSFQLDPGRRAVLTLMPTVEEILLTNRGPGTIEMDLEDDHLRTFLAVTLRPGGRHTSRERSLARLRFANQSTEPASIEFRIWGADDTGFVLDLAPAPADLPDEADL